MTGAPFSGDLTPSLVVRLRLGEAEAGETLERLYRAAIVRFAWGYLRSLDEAEDAAQEIFARVLQSATVPDDFRVWLYRVARNHCLNLVRSRRRRRDDARLPTGAELPDSLTGNLSRLVREEDRERLAELLERLPEHLREVLRLRYTEELGRAEIAAVLELPVSVVKSRLFEGLKKLRADCDLDSGAAP